MVGYKLLNEDLSNQYGYKYELNKNYILNGELVWSKNGFHFCTKPENTLRYAKDKNGFTIALIEAFGEIVCGDDYFENDYYGFDGLYASSEFMIKKILSRKEIIDSIISSNNFDRVIKLINLTKLTKNEIELIKSIKFYQDINPYIDYYQYNIEDAFTKKYKKN